MEVGDMDAFIIISLTFTFMELLSDVTKVKKSNPVVFVKDFLKLPSKSRFYQIPILLFIFLFISFLFFKLSTFLINLIPRIFSSYPSKLSSIHPSICQQNLDLDFYLSVFAMEFTACLFIEGLTQRFCRFNMSSFISHVL